MAREASYYRTLEESLVECQLCPRNCRIANQKYGSCGVRFNDNGKLQALTYGHISAIHFDPIEKKPLYHFFPGSQILSFGSHGCNLHCSFCQNYEISQVSGDESLSRIMTPADIVLKAMQNPENIGIAFTYNEPTVFFEMMEETAHLAKKSDLLNVVISNGYINQQPLEKLISVTDAFNIDLKSFSQDFYLRMTGGMLSPVLRTIKSIRTAGVHLELTFLLIPGLNDDQEQFSHMIHWIQNEIGPDCVLHISRYFPHFKLQAPPTPISQLVEFYDFAKSKLHYVYLGNVLHEGCSDTVCPACHKTLIRRDGYNTVSTGITGDGRCRFCHHPIVRN